MSQIEMTKTFSFDAAHFLPNVPDGHKCKRMHGHSFRFKVHLLGELDPHLGWVMDFADLKSVVKPLVYQYLDHYLLNDVPGLQNPTSENLAIWLWNQLKPKLSLLVKITVYETCTSSCSYSGPAANNS